MGHIRQSALGGGSLHVAIDPQVWVGLTRMGSSPHLLYFKESPLFHASTRSTYFLLFLDISPFWKKGDCLYLYLYIALHLWLWCNKLGFHLSPLGATYMRVYTVDL